DGDKPSVPLPHARLHDLTPHPRHHPAARRWSRACARQTGYAILSRGSTVWTAVADERRRGFMTTPGNPQDSTQSYTQPGYAPPAGEAGSMPPPGQPGYGQQDSPQDHSPRGASDDQTWAMLSYILALVASIIAPLVIYLVKMNQSRYVRFHAAQALNLGI